VELVDAGDSKSPDLRVLRVRVPPWASWSIGVRSLKVLSLAESTLRFRTIRDLPTGAHAAGDFNPRSSAATASGALTWSRFPARIPFSRSSPSAFLLPH